MLFGFLHGCFIWNGDILFDYSLPALLFLYPARKLPAKVMILSGLFLSLTVATFGLLLYTKAGIEIPLSRQAAAVTLRQQHQQPLSAADVAVEKEWQATVAHHRITPETVKKQLTEARSGYWQHVSENFQQYFGPGVFHHANFLLIIENLSVMLIGMGLIKTGFLRGESSNRTYFYTILAGFAVSLPLYLYGILHCYASGFYFLALDKWLWLPYNLTRDAGMLAIAAVVMLMVKNGILRTPQRWLAAVGKTAFSNYIGTSILCQFIFLWGPWKLFGKPEYYQLMYVVFAVWAVNIVFSTLWLQRFEYGPLEWLWRSLTYGKAQPMRLRELPAAA